MAGFNNARNGRRFDETKNHEGARAYALSAKAELFSAVATTFLEPKYYEAKNDRLDRIIDLVDQVNDDEFVAKLAVYARQEMNLRSVPIALVVALAKRHSGDDLVRRAARNVICRADELSEMLACYCGMNPDNDARKGSKTKRARKVSNQLIRGIGDAFLKFDEYQLSKYNRNAREFSLKDVIHLTHPRPADDEQRALFKRVIEGALAPAYTWERELSVAGKSEKAKREAWQKIIESGKLGYMAALRNLANFIKLDIGTEHIDMVCKMIEDPVQVAKSRQLPYRFLTAYRMLFGSETGVWSNRRPGTASGSIYAKRIYKALDAAATHSAANLPINSTERICNAADVSGSMYQQISGKSIVMCFDIGLMMAASFSHKCDYVVAGVFGNDWMETPVGDGGVLTEVDRMESLRNKVGYSTNGYKVIKAARLDKKVFDRFVLWTDCELYGGGPFDDHNSYDIVEEWKMYKRDINPDAKLVLVDLAGYGTAPLRVEENDVMLVSGFSDKIWDMMAAVENGESMVSVVENVSLA